MKHLKDLFSKGRIISYKKREVVFSPTYPPRGMYRLKSGFLYGYSISKTNKKLLQSILKPGDIFPLLWGITTSNTSRRFNLEALTNATVYCIEKDKFFNEVYTNKNLTEELITTLSEYLSIYVERVENLEFEKLEKRLIARLLHFSDRFGENIREKIHITVPLTHEFIGLSINASRSNVTRELKKLEKEKIIAVQKKYLIILDRNKLVKKLNDAF